MKVQFRSILFALVVPLAACGGDRESTTITETPKTESPFKSEPSIESPVTKPAEQPKNVAEIPAPIPTKYDDALALGRELVAKGLYADAKEMFEAAIELDKKKADPHIELARVHIALSEKGKAVASAKQATKLAPLSSQAWNTMGRAELNAHKYEEAIAAFTKAIELNPDNAFAWNNLGYTELLLKRYDDAAEHLAEATTRKGATGYMFNNLGTALEHLDLLDDARTAYETGGNLGSKEAASSRKRLEGVKTIAIAKAEDVEDEPEGEVHDEVRGESPAATKEYELTDEGEVSEEPATEDSDVEDIGSGDVEPSDEPVE